MAPSSSAAASMAALAAAAASGDASDDSGAAAHNGALPPPHGAEDNNPTELAAAGGAGAFSSSRATARRVAAVAGASGSSAVASAAARSRGAGAAAGGIVPSCQVERCNADMGVEKRYNKRHKVCDAHRKASVVLLAGLRQRFCQQCSRFHELSHFDDTKKSCRLRLAGHNERRRRNPADAHDQNGGRGDVARNHFQIR